MPKYYCDYCDTFLTHDSPSVRKTHCQGRKHKDNVKYYFQRWMEQEAQTLIDATTAAFKAGKIATNPFAQPPPGAAVPPPGLAPGGMPPGSRPGMPTNFNPMLPPPFAFGGIPQAPPPGFAPPTSVPPHMRPPAMK